MAWWNTLTTLQQLFYTIAIPATVLLLIQTALLLFGFGHDSDADGGDTMDVHDGLDHDGDAGFDMDHDFDPSVDHDLDHGFIPEHDGDPVHDAGVSAADSADLRLFSLRGIIAFFVMMGWTGVLFATILPPWLTVAFALAMGFAGLYVTAKLFQWSSKLQQSGNIHWNRAVGHTAEVYVPIPPSRKGYGKVMVLLQERLSEKDAVTDSRQVLATGTQVMIREVLRDGKLVVEPMKAEKKV